MPGWEAPMAYALGVAVGSAPVDWRAVNYPNLHELPAVVLGWVLGHRRGSATYWLGLDEFDEAIRLLGPAEACAAFDHPNLWAWQQLRSEITESTLPAESRVVAVFLSHGPDSATDDIQRELADEIGLS